MFVIYRYLPHLSKTGILSLENMAMRKLAVTTITGLVVVITTLFGLGAQATVIPLNTQSSLTPLAVLDDLSLIAPHVYYRPLAVGEGEENFYVDSGFDAQGRSQITAVLLQDSQWAHFYIESQYWQSLSTSEQEEFRTTVEALAQEFDSNIYPNLTAYLGEVWTPGIDGDPKITILLSNLAGGAGGYFNPQDEFPRSQFFNSNEREILYINARFVTMSRIKAFLAHEFQHLISFNQKDRRLNISDDVWLNEVRSEYVPTYLGYDQSLNDTNLGARFNQFMNDAEDSLVEWQGLNQDYAQVSLFGHYLADRFGNDVFPEMLKSTKVGIESVEEAVAKLGTPLSFEKLYGDWLMTVLFNDPVLDGGQFAYSNPLLAGFQVVPTAAYGILGETIIQRVNAVKPWSPSWFVFIDLNGSVERELKLVFKGRSNSAGYFAGRVIKQMSDGRKVIEEFKTSGNGTFEKVINNFGTEFDKLYVISYYVQSGRFTDNSLDLMPYQLSVSTSVPPANTLAVTQLEPSRAFLLGGDKIKIRGQNLNTVEKLSVDGETVPFEKSIDGQLISFVAPAHAPGAARIEFELEDGTLETSPISLIYLALRPEGALVRAQGDYKVYIVKGRFIRHILNPEVFNIYGHLRWEDIIDIPAEELALYAESRLIRADGDEKVYEVDQKGVKHWLNMTAEAFALSGHDWNSVYIVNSRERDYYKLGDEIIN